MRSDQQVCLILFNGRASYLGLAPFWEHRLVFSPHGQHDCREHSNIGQTCVETPASNLCDTRAAKGIQIVQATERGQSHEGLPDVLYPDVFGIVWHADFEGYVALLKLDKSSRSGAACYQGCEGQVHEKNPRHARTIESSGQACSDLLYDWGIQEDRQKNFHRWTQPWRYFKVSNTFLHSCLQAVE